jgi:hypothetical protein
MAQKQGHISAKYVTAHEMVFVFIVMFKTQISQKCRGSLKILGESRTTVPH